MVGSVIMCALGVSLAFVTIYCCKAFVGRRWVGCNRGISLTCGFRLTAMNVIDEVFIRRYCSGCGGGAVSMASSSFDIVVCKPVL
jgi:hypothetical protein